MPERIWYLLGVKLSGEATQAELDEYYALLEENPGLETTVQFISRFWFHSATSSASGYSNDLWQKHLARMQARGIVLPQHTGLSVAPQGGTPVTRRFLWFSLAAAAVFLLGIAAWWMMRPETTPVRAMSENRIVTRPASRTRLTLADGSEVWLNGSSKLTTSVGFGKDDRHVWLEGEGYFNVEKNTELPFIIHTRNMQVRVTGTVFNVRAYPEEEVSETALLEGSVEVILPAAGNKKYVLKPHQKLVVDSRNAASADAAPADTRVQPIPAPAATVQQLAKPVIESEVVETGWVNNLLLFSDESFRQLANKMEKWYGVKIVFTSEQLQELRFTGSFKTESLSEALTALQMTAPFSFTINDNTVLISAQKKKR